MTEGLLFIVGREMRLTSREDCPLGVAYQLAEGGGGDAESAVLLAAAGGSGGAAATVCLRCRHSGDRVGGGDCVVGGDLVVAPWVLDVLGPEARVVESGALSERPPVGLHLDLRFQRHFSFRHWDERYSSKSPTLCFSATGWSTEWPDVNLAQLTKMCPVLLSGQLVRHGSLLALPVLDTVMVFRALLEAQCADDPAATMAATYLIDTPAALRSLVAISRETEPTRESASNISIALSPSAQSLLAQLEPLCLAALESPVSPLSFHSLLLSGPAGSGKTLLLDSLVTRIAVAETDGRELLLLRLGDARHAPSLAGPTALNSTGWSQGAERWSEAAAEEEIARLLVGLGPYCCAREVAALSRHLDSAEGRRRGARVLVVADNLDDIFAVQGEEGGGRTKRLAWMLRRLSALASASSASQSGAGLQVMIVGTTSLPPQSVPQTSTGAPHFEKIVRVRTPTFEDRRAVLRNQLADVALGPGPDPRQQEVPGDDGQCEQWAQALAHLTAGYMPGDLVALATRMRCIHLGSAEQSASIPWSAALKAVSLAVPVHMQELASYVGSLGGSVGGGAGGGGAGAGAEAGEGPSWGDFIGDEGVIKGLQRVLRRGQGQPGDAESATSAYLAARTPRGIVLHGPPACGKTFLARILARESNRHFISVRAPDLLSEFFGQTEAHVRGIFARARAVGACVLLFDEFEVLACRRGRGEGGGDTGLQGRVLSTFLNELDGVSGGAGTGGEVSDILVVVACSDLEQLDEALLRPGRLQHHVHLGAPRQADIAAMLTKRLGDLQARGASCHGIDLDAVLASFMPCRPRGADVDALLRAAVFSALREAGDGGEIVLSTRHLVDALPAPFVLENIGNTATSI